MLILLLSGFLLTWYYVLFNITKKNFQFILSLSLLLIFIMIILCYGFIWFHNISLIPICLLKWSTKLLFVDWRLLAFLLITLNSSSVSVFVISISILAISTSSLLLRHFLWGLLTIYQSISSYGVFIYPEGINMCYWRGIPIATCIVFSYLIVLYLIGSIITLFPQEIKSLSSLWCTHEC